MYDKFMRCHLVHWNDVNKMQLIFEFQVDQIHKLHIYEDTEL